MHIFPINNIKFDAGELRYIEEVAQSTLRIIAFSRDHLADDLLNSYLSKITTYKQLFFPKVK